MALEPAPHPLPMDLPFEARSFAHPAPAACGWLLHRGEDVSQGKGKDTEHRNKNEEQHDRHETPLLLRLEFCNKLYFDRQ